jgi:DNA-binding NarL/FixJ family response regulator
LELSPPVSFSVRVNDQTSVGKVTKAELTIPLAVRVSTYFKLSRAQATYLGTPLAFFFIPDFPGKFVLLFFQTMKRLRILLADDHDLVREGLGVLVEHESAWKVCGEAKTGAEAVQKAQSLRPDIAVVDFKLPDIDGLETTRQIKHLMPECEVLIFTGSGESDELIREAFACGAKAFILKTEAGKFLLDAIKSLAEHKPFFTDKSSAVIFARFAPQPKKSARDEAETGLRLSSGEQEMVRLLADGHRNESVAKTQGISVRAVENQRAAIMKKLQVKTFADLVRYAVRNGIIEA